MNLNNLPLHTAVNSGHHNSIVIPLTVNVSYIKVTVFQLAKDLLCQSGSSLPYKVYNIDK